MERCSYLYGTLANGVYSPLGRSESLPEFFNKIGAVNPTAVLEAVNGTLAGFPKMDASTAAFREHYYSQPANDLPVSVRYAPMHLYKKPGMPKGMQAFCALCVSGSENKQEDEVNRITVYSHTHYIAREHMHQAVTVKNGERITYLDQIFGTELLSHVQVADHRNGKVSVSLDELPRKVYPTLRNQDAAIVYNAIHAVFAEQPVVIRLEKGVSFNSRAWELLIPIYSLLPPRLATETGFATYQEPNTIRGMVADTSLRIFVLPAECELKAVEDAGMLVMDLNDPKTLPAVPKDELTKALNRWVKLDWELRQVAMEKLFADTETTFQDQELFVKRTKDFFADPYFAWEKSGEDKGSITSLAELKAKYDSFPVCALIPWVKERFAKKIPSLLRKGVTLAQLTADALALALYSKDEEEKKLYQQLYRFAADMASVDPVPVAKSTGKLVKAQTLEDVAPEIAEANRRTEQAVADGKAAVAAEQEKAAAAAAAAAAVLAQAKADGEAAVAQAKAAGESAVAQAVAEGKAAVAAEQEKTEQVKKVAAEKIKAERDAHAATQQSLAAEQTAHQTTRQSLAAEQTAHTATQQSLAAEQTAHEATKSQLAEANQRLEKAKVAYTELKKAKAESDSHIEDAKKAQAAAETAKSELEAAKAEAEAAKAKADKIIKENNKRMIIFAAAGFLVAALIFGVIMLIVGLAGGKDEPETVPTEVTEMTEAPTEEPTEAPTEEPTEAPTEEPTEEATEPEDPDLSDWSDETAAQWIWEHVYAVETVNYCSDPEAWTGDLLEGFDPLAEFIFWGEDDVVRSAYLYQRIPGEEAEGMPPVDSMVDPGDETTEPVEEEPAIQAVSVEGACLVLTSQDFVLVVYGDESAMAPALEIFGMILDEEAEVASVWALNETTVSVDNAAEQLLGEGQWWRNVTVVSADGEAYAELVPAITEDGLTGLYLELEDGSLLVFVDAEDEATVAALSEKLELYGGICATDATLVAVNVPAEEAE